MSDRKDRLVRLAQRRYDRRAAAYQKGRRSTELVDTKRLALLVVEADQWFARLWRLPR